MAKFSPGESGNVNGRPKGSKNHSTTLLEAIRDDVPALLEATKEKALKGDMAAMRLLLERALPVRKATAPEVEIPELETADTLTDKAKAVLVGVARGDIPPDTGCQLLAAIAATGRVLEIDELTKRLEALEQLQEDSL